MNTHSKWSPSSSATWTGCTAAPDAIEEARKKGIIPEDDLSEYAQEGTIAHEYAEKVATGKMRLSEIDQPMRDHIAGYLAECQERIDLSSLLAPSEHAYEKKFPIFYRPEDRGTADFFQIRHYPSGAVEIDILDFKYGQGVKVEPFENTQLAIYARSAIEEEQMLQGVQFNPETTFVHMGIYQPRHHSFQGSAEWWDLRLSDLIEFTDWIGQKYEESRDPERQQFNPAAKTCQFCPLRKVCDHRAKVCFKGAGSNLDPFAEFEDETALVLPDAETLQSDGYVTPDQVAWVVQHGKEMKKIIDDIIQGETDRLLAGGEIRKAKLVAGSLKPRQWVNEAAAEKMASNYLNVEERSQPRKFKTAPQIIAALKKHLNPKDEGTKPLSKQARIAFGFEEQGNAKTQPLIHRPKGNPSLVPIDDPRPGLAFTQPDADFEEVEDWA